MIISSLDNNKIDWNNFKPMEKFDKNTFAVDLKWIDVMINEKKR